MMTWVSSLETLLMVRTKENELTNILQYFVQLA